MRSEFGFVASSAALLLLVTYLVTGSNALNYGYVSFLSGMGTILTALQIAVAIPLALVGIVAFASRSYPPERRPSLAALAVLFLFLAYLSLSVLWAMPRGRSIAVALSLDLTFAVGAYAALCLSPSRRRFAILAALAILGVGSLVMGLFFPSYGLMSGLRRSDAPHIGSWRGVFHHKNILGGFSALGFGLSLLAALRMRRSALLAAALAGVFGALVLLSQSKTGIVVGVGLAGTVTLVIAGQRWPLHRRLFGWIWGGALVVGLACLPYYYDRILESLNGDSTLTGRAQLWAMLLALVPLRPFLGYGVASFWPSGDPTNVTPRSEVLAIQTAVRWPVPHGHNGYIDLLVETGAIGLGLGLIFLGVAFFLSWRRAFDPRAAGPAFDRAWPFLVILCFTVQNVTESFWLHRNAWALWSLVVMGYWVVSQRTSQA